MNTDDNGVSHPGLQARHFSEGMALLDYFAAQIACGLIQRKNERGIPDYLPSERENLAGHAYYFAEAMLKEREKWVGK